jgi:hypothetical protein
MKLSRSLWLIPVLIILASLAIGGSIALGSGVHSGVHEDNAFKPFYGVSPELKAELEQIAFSNSEIQELTQGKDSNFVADGQAIHDKDFSLAVGVYLQDDITKEEFREWIKGGRQDSSLIKEYVGVLNIGYNDKYQIVIDKANDTITSISQKETARPDIPEVSTLEKQHAIEIALADTTVQQLLKGKNYQIAPDGKIGVWHEGDTKLGVAFQIDFDQPYTIDMTLPKYNSEACHIVGEVEGVIIDVLLGENRVAMIVPQAPLAID